MKTFMRNTIISLLALVLAYAITVGWIYFLQSLQLDAHVEGIQFAEHVLMMNKKCKVDHTLVGCG